MPREISYATKIVNIKQVKVVGLLTHEDYWQIQDGDKVDNLSEWFDKFDGKYVTIE